MLIPSFYIESLKCEMRVYNEFYDRNMKDKLLYRIPPKQNQLFPSNIFNTVVAVAFHALSSDS